jgi:uncharacterized protein YndB with AHSA1/START domain
MAEFEREKQMPASAERVFDIVADLEHLNRWLPDMVSVHPTDTDTGGPDLDLDAVEVDVQRSDGEHHAPGTVGVRREQLRLEWGSHGTGDYAGWLQVSHADDDGSYVTLHLSFLGDQPESHAGAAATDIEHRLDDAIERLARLVSERT